MCGRLVAVGSYGWINLQQVRTVVRREGGGAVVHLVGGQEIGLLPDEADALEGELRKQCQHTSRFPVGVELR